LTIRSTNGCRAPERSPDVEPIWTPSCCSWQEGAGE
jgi:hypothetical protein